MMPGGAIATTVRPPLDQSVAERSLRDLMGLLALPALWAGRDGATVLELMTSAIEHVVAVDLCYFNVPSIPNQPKLETLRVQGVEIALPARHCWSDVIAAFAELPIGGSVQARETPLGFLRIVRLGLGFSAGQGCVWFAAGRDDFPSVTQLAFLRAATSLAATGLAAARSAYEREQAARAKDEFLAMLGHELRNPLAPITTALQLIKLRSGKPHDKYHSIIERQVAHLSRLVDDLLDVSRITRGKIELRREKIQYGTIISRAIESVSPLIEARQHSLSVNLENDAELLFADPTRLTQVFSNLLTNAAKYTEPQGTISVRGRVESAWLVFEIEDNGPGISSDLMPRLFDIFEQGPSTIHRSSGGLGIGLALVKNLVELHGGTVKAENNGPKQGSKFTVLLPTAPPSEAFREPVRGARQPSPSIGGGSRVLVVDDNLDALDAISNLLREYGFEVAVAKNGAEALDVCAAFDPQISILDIGLPDIDGYQLAKILLKNTSGALRIFALSGYGQAGDRQRSAEAGFERHFVKPVDFSDLLLALSPGALQL